MLRGSEELTRPHLAPAFQASGRSGPLAKPAARSWPRSIRRARLFETSFTLAQLRLFRLDALGEGGGLKALKLESYARGARVTPECCKGCCSPTSKPGAKVGPS